MGSLFSTPSTPLSLTADSFTATLQPGEVAHYSIELTREWLEKKQDLVVRVHVEKGRLQGSYLARDKSFPNQRRKLYSTTHYCSCPSLTCDHCYPYCLNSEGGICLECMSHDDTWTRIAHVREKGGLGSTQGNKNGNVSSSASNNDPAAEAAAMGFPLTSSSSSSSSSSTSILSPPYHNHTDYEFSLRLSPTVDGPLLPADRYYLSIVAAEENVPAALRQQRLLEGEPEYHSTSYTIWIESRLPRLAPQTGNDERYEETEAHRAKKKEKEEKKKKWGRKVEEMINKSQGHQQEQQQQPEERKESSDQKETSTKKNQPTNNDTLPNSTADDADQPTTATSTTSPEPKQKQAPDHTATILDELEKEERKIFEHKEDEREEEKKEPSELQQQPQQHSREQSQQGDATTTAVPVNNINDKFEI